MRSQGQTKHGGWGGSRQHGVNKHAQTAHIIIGTKDIPNRRPPSISAIPHTNFSSPHIPDNHHINYTALGYVASFLETKRDYMMGVTLPLLLLLERWGYLD